MTEQPRRPGAPQRWWHDAVGYEIYVRSFSDSGGDGVGDLAGVATRLDHLAALGVDVIWLTPFYPSPFADFGYDVADYCDVDPLFGSLDDFDHLVKAAHEVDLRVVVDIVPNHSSTEHPWFRQAIADPSGPYRDYYIWSDPGPDGGVPNNWVSCFGGPAWTLDEASGQYYLHLFLPQQADLNWRNPAVQQEFERILRFWLDRGVDGFRIDVAQAMVKDDVLRSNPELAPWDPEASRWDQWESFEHRHDILQAPTLDLFARWREIVEEYDALLLGETYVLDAAQLATLLRGDGMHAGFWFAPMHMGWDAAEIRQVLQAPLAEVHDPRVLAWVASSHDEVRPPSRFGGGDVGRARALALSTLLLGLPGMPFLYQGEELGLLEGVVPEDRRADPVGADVTASRDGCRTPMPWEPGPAFGFSTSEDTWLPDGGRVDTDTASVQRETPGSWFHRYRELLALRHREPELRDVAIEWIDADAAVVAYRRGTLAVAANVADTETAAGLAGTILFSTTGRSGELTAGDVLAADEAVVVRLAD